MKCVVCDISHEVCGVQGVSLRDEQRQDGAVVWAWSEPEVAVYRHFRCQSVCHRGGRGRYRHVVWGGLGGG